MSNATEQTTRFTDYRQNDFGIWPAIRTKIGQDERGEIFRTRVILRRYNSNGIDRLAIESFTQRSEADGRLSYGSDWATPEDLNSENLREFIAEWREISPDKTFDAYSSINSHHSCPF
jgi:hypothetical protein